MPDAVEMHVRTIVAQVLRALPENIRPETMLLAGVVSYDQLREIAQKVKRSYGIAAFTIYQLDAWTSVGDIVLATEDAIAALHREAA